MAWLTRGTGRSNNSLTGYGVLVGYHSKKVLAYVVKNRKCRKCDLGHSPTDHDCHLNFRGSAKSMESVAAVDLASHEFLKACSAQLGMVISDNDSCAILALRNALPYEIIKHSDKNHTSKGVKSALYGIVKNYKELNSEAITYLTKCFGYCVSQNIGNEESMSAAIRNIPEHAFNNHQNCKQEWCQFLSKPDTYKHKVIGDGFKDQGLYVALKNLFDTLANKCHKFIAGVSSNPNEGFHSQTTKIHPKDRFYGGSGAAENRIIFSSGKKNEGEQFVSKLLGKCSLSSGKHEKNFVLRYAQKSMKRAVKQRTPKFKARRLFLKQQRLKLKKKNEDSEVIGYESNIGLLDTLEQPILDVHPESSDRLIVLYDLETSGLSKNCEILQIAAKYGDAEFSIYVQPLQRIDEQASKIHGLRMENGHLTLHGNLVESVPISTALHKFYTFLHSLGKKCILTAHNGKFDYSRLCRSIRKYHLLNHFSTVVSGFIDTLPVIQKATGLKGKGCNSIEGLANKFQLDLSNAHDATKDISLLEQILTKLDIHESILLEAECDWEKSLSKIELSDISSSQLLDLSALEECTSKETRKKIKLAKINFNMIFDSYASGQVDGVQRLLINVIGNGKLVKKICTFFERLFEFIQN